MVSGHTTGRLKRWERKIFFIEVSSDQLTVIVLGRVGLF